ncbi:hypothetical protein FRC14_005135 [Serendipita sp. 396]|nr:hypothetical protein FRC14_005135 [Serendipita sp. 396]KAG8802828.1 hypothetical protein FRC16_008549 [Serendipita sp. 398]
MRGAIAPSTILSSCSIIKACIISQVEQEIPTERLILGQSSEKKVGVRVCDVVKFLRTKALIIGTQIVI